jgi:acyl carrier protein|tara:strand:- start:263 stop:505 length:243 start_codon:yes stop_codon:yes gene_type:complete
MKKKINFEFIKKVFHKALNIGDYELKLDSKFEEVPEWDSLGHMRIIQELEEQLNIEFDINEIIDVDTVKKIINLAKSKIK